MAVRQIETERTKDGRLRISRRTFLKASGATGLFLFATRLFRVKWPAKPALPPEGEGVVTERWVNTSCLNCPARCAITVRVVNGRAVRIKGNSLSRVSDGEICPRGHVGLQVLYDPARIAMPVKRTNPSKGRDVDPGWAPTTWSAALDEIAGRLASVRASGPERLAIFSGLNARSDEDLIGRFAQAYGTPNLIKDDSVEVPAEKTGRMLADGNYGSLAYDLGKTSYVLAFGASILESERPLARNLRMWGKMRRERPTRGKVVVFDPRYSVTAAKADEWVPSRPGTDAGLALAIANVLISEELYDQRFVADHSVGFEPFRDLVLRQYSPEQVAAITDVDAAVIRHIAREFGDTRPALAWAGRGVTAWPGGTETVFAIHCLNALAGAIDAPGGVLYQEDPPYRGMPDLKLDSIAESGLQERPTDAFGRRNFIIRPLDPREMLLSSLPALPTMGIGFNANFSMTGVPGTWDEGLKHLPYYVHVSPVIDEMALYADIVLPAPTFLEQWGYDHSPAGPGFAELKLKQPVAQVWDSAKSVGDVIFEMAARLGGSIGSAFTGIGDNAAGFVRYRTESLLPFSELTDKGVWVGPDYRYGKYDRIFKTPSGRFEFQSAALAKANLFGSSYSERGLPQFARPRFQGDNVFQGSRPKYSLTLLSYQPVLAVESGRQNYPWAQEVFFVQHGVGWTSLAEINRETARSLGVRDGDEVWVESAFGRVKLKARVTDWLRPDCVAIARGQGHYAPGQWQKGIGVNPNDLLGVDFDRLSGQAALFNTKVRVTRA